MTASDAPAILKQGARDFGGLSERTPAVITWPVNAGQVAAVIQWARSEGLPCGVRGTGHAQGGQSLLEGGVLLSTRELRAPVALASDRVTAGSGWTMGELLDSTLPHGLVPLVRPDYLGLSLGGLLCAGGVGRASVQYGFAANHVTELELVDDQGQVSTVRPGDAAFERRLGAMGDRRGVITNVAMSVRRFVPRVQISKYRFASVAALWPALSALAAHPQLTGLEAKVSWRDGGWRIRVHAEAEGDETFADLPGQQRHRRKRMAAADALRSEISPSVADLHPWVDLIVEQGAAPLLDALLAATAPEVLPYVLVLVVPLGPGSTLENLRCDAGAWLLGLFVSAPAFLLPRLREQLGVWHALAENVGARAYAGGVGLTA